MDPGEEEPVAEAAESASSPGQAGRTDMDCRLREVGRRWQAGEFVLRKASTTK